MSLQGPDYRRFASCHALGLDVLEARLEYVKRPNLLSRYVYHTTYDSKRMTHRTAFRPYKSPVEFQNSAKADNAKTDSKKCSLLDPHQMLEER